MEVLAVDRDRAHSWNCPHPLPPEREQAGDHDESCHGVKRSDHDKRWHDDTYTHSHDHLSRRFDDQNQKFLNENFDTYVAKKHDLFDCFKRSKMEFMQPEFYRRVSEVYKPLPGSYTAIWRKVAVVDAKPFSWLTKTEPHGWRTRDLETIPLTSFQSWLM